MELSQRTTDYTVRRPSRRRRLGSAVVAVLTLAAAAVLTTGPAAASVSTFGGTVNAGTFTVTGGTIAADPAPAGTHNTITSTSPRTLLDFSTFNLSAGTRLDINVASDSDIVLIRVASGTEARVDGFLNVTTGLAASPGTPTLGEVPTNVGGNVWFVAPTGVTFGGYGRVNAGGLLATSANVTSDQDFLDGGTNLNFAGGTSSVVQNSGSVVSGHGGHVAMVADSVTQAGTISDAGNRTDVLLAGARDFSLSLGQASLGAAQRVLAFSMPSPGGGYPGGQSTSPTPLGVYGSVSGSNIYLVSDTSYPGGSGPYVSGSLNTTGAAASGDGTLAVVSGGGMARDDTTSPARAVARAAASPQDVSIAGALTAGPQALVRSSGDLTVTSTGTLGAEQIVMATGGTYGNAGTVAPTPGGRFLVYAPRYTDISGGPDSNAKAIWGKTIDNQAPGTISGSRYVFQYPPDLVFRARDVTKSFDETGVLGYDSPPLQPPSVAGSFLPDDGPAYTGIPVLTSDGAAAGTKVPRGGTFPISIGIGSLQSPLGYAIGLVSGTLTITDPTPPVVTHTTTGNLGANGWYTSGPVSVDWTASDPESEWLDVTGCADVTVTADQLQTVLPCRADSAGGDTRDDVTVGKDGIAPDLTITASIGGDPYVEGTWTNSTNVTLDFACTDATSGPDPASVPASRQIVPTTTLVHESCSDLAGNMGSNQFQVNVDTTPPVLEPLGDIELTSPDGAGVVAGWDLPTATDTQDESVDVTCAPAADTVFAVGTHTVECTATDHASNTDTDTFTLTVTELPTAIATFDRPIDPAPVMNIAKLGRVIPVKATVTADGTSVTGPSDQPVHLSVAGGVDCTDAATTDGLESYAAGSSNVGNLLRWDETAQRWTYNLDTSAFAMKPNACYRVTVHYGGTVDGDRASGGVPAGSFLVQARK